VKAVKFYALDAAQELEALVNMLRLCHIPFDVSVKWVTRHDDSQELVFCLEYNEPKKP
jgi:hypothetical protein